MNIKKTEYKKLDETIYEYKHESGLSAFVIPKKGYLKKYATFGTHFGSINNQFIESFKTEITKVPDGVAHFLEHKLFEQEDGNVTERFTDLGSQPNAFTSFNQTVYLFSCTDKFTENFKLLLNFVQNPFITEESVEREKGIIGEEIKMYQDNPNWRVFFNLLNAFYKNNSVKIDIAGSVESISHINKEILYKCYNTFYHPSNMVIVVIGDVEPKEVFELVESAIKTTSSKPEVKRIFTDEIIETYKDYIELSLQVSTPIFQAGFKDNIKNLSDDEKIMRDIAIKILLTMIMGKSSNLYNQLYSEGLINSSFECDYTLEENYAFSIFGGEAQDPTKVKTRILSEIDSIKKAGLDKDSFNRLKKAMKGKSIRQLNSIERMAKAYISNYFRNINLFDYFEGFDKISYEYINKVFNEHFIDKNFAMSIINPMRN